MVKWIKEIQQDMKVQAGKDIPEHEVTAKANGLASMKYITYILFDTYFIIRFLFNI